MVVSVREHCFSHLWQMYHCQAETCAVDLASLYPSCLCSENHRYFSHKIRKQRRRLKQWPVVFHSGRYCSVGLSHFSIFITSPLKCICTTCNISGKKRRGKLENKEDLEPLNPFIYGTDSPALAQQPRSQQTSQLWMSPGQMGCAAVLELGEGPEAVLQPRQWPWHSWGPWGWALEQTCLSVAPWTLLHAEIAGGQARGDRNSRNPNYSVLPVVFVLYLISISVTGDGVKEEDKKE